MAKMLHKEHSTHSHSLDKSLAKGDAVVARFISGATVGALTGGALSAGSGILPGAVVGGVVGIVAPEALSSIGKSHDGHGSRSA